MKTTFPLLAGLVCTAAVVPAFAQIYSYRFSGTIDEISLNENEVVPISLGQRFEGQLTFRDVPDQNPDPRRAQYNQDASFHVTFPEIDFTFIDQPAAISVDNDFGGTLFYDRFHYNCSGYWQAGDYLFRNVWIYCSSSDPSPVPVLTSTDLPVNLDPDAFEQSRFVLHGWSEMTGDSFQVEGDLTELALVPEPSMLLMLAAGGLILRRKRTSKN